MRFIPAVSPVQIQVPLRNSSFPSVCMWRNFDARMDMVMT